MMQLQNKITDNFFFMLQTIDENRINDIPFSIFNHQSETIGSMVEKFKN